MKNNELAKDTCALILAGGKGVRFWPLSQENKPKQFLKIMWNDSLLVATIKRIRKIIPQNKIYIIANNKQKSILNKEIKKLNFPKGNILFEPEAKNTAPAIGWAAREILRRNANAIMMVFPCDHYIANLSNFYKDVENAVYIAKQGRLVVFGIRPTRAETGYGYIKIKNPCLNYYDIDKFIEKPSLDKATVFLKDRSYFWNSGIFVWKAQEILKEIQLYEPDLFVRLNKIKDRKNSKNLWHNIKPISIDNAVLEKSKKIVMIAARFIWSDLGSWYTYSEFLKKDKHGNHFRGDCKDSGSRNIAVINFNQPIRTLGLKDLVIVNTKDGLFISHKCKTGDIKRLIGD